MFLIHKLIYPSVLNIGVTSFRDLCYIIEGFHSPSSSKITIFALLITDIRGCNAASDTEISISNTSLNSTVPSLMIFRLKQSRLPVPIPVEKVSVSTEKLKSASSVAKQEQKKLYLKNL